MTDAVSGGSNESEPILMLAAVNMVPAGVENDRKLTCPLTSQTPVQNEVRDFLRVIRNDKLNPIFHAYGSENGIANLRSPRNHTR